MDTILANVRLIPAGFLFFAQVAVIILLSYVLSWFWRHVLIKIARRTTTNLDRMIFEATDRAAQMAFIFAGVNFSWKLYGSPLLSLLEEYDINLINIDKLLDYGDRFFSLLFALSLVFLTGKVVFAAVDWFDRDVAQKTESTFDEKILYSLRKVFKAIFFVATFLIFIEHIGLNLSKLWAAAGIGSLALAFAAKDTLANMISGVIILFDRPFLVGDRVELADGSFGDVVDIGLRSTKILSFDNTIFILPNAEISNQRITNHSYPDYNLKVAHTIGVAYGSDLDKVKEVLNGVLVDHPLVLNEPEWGIWFTTFGDSSLDILVKYWIKDYKDKFTVLDEVNMEINKRFEAEKIEIPFPQRDVHIIKTDQS